MSSSRTQHERITVEDVKVGDRVARTRTEPFPPVESIDEGPTTRRLHFGRTPCPEPPLLVIQEGKAEGELYCPDCHRWDTYVGELSPRTHVTIADDGHGLVGGGNIRPRRTAKLWRIVATVDPELTPAEVAEQERQEWAG